MGFVSLREVLVGVLLVHRHLVGAAHQDDRSAAMCEQPENSENSVGSNLLQARSHRSAPASDAAMTASVDLGRISIAQRVAAAGSQVSNLAAQAALPTLPADLPPHLLVLGKEVLGSEEAVHELVASTQFHNITYGGVPVLLRSHADSFAPELFTYESNSYGLDTLFGLHAGDGLMNILDLGGNYGVVSIAAFRRYPTRMRVITVEPLPTTYFILRWNMWLNGVPELPSDSRGKPGILALNRALADSNVGKTQFCYAPPRTLSPFVCNCTEQPGYHCNQVNRTTIDRLFSMFGNDNITMVKMDCEGCESYALPFIAGIQKAAPGRIARLGGELHVPDQALESLACSFQTGYVLELCPIVTATGPGYESRDLQCGVGAVPCDAQRTPQHVELIGPKYAKA